MFGTRNKGQEDENAFKAQAAKDRAAADVAIGKAAAVDPIEERRRAQAIALDKWKTGESGPIDVRNMPGGAADMALFNDSLKVHDAGRAGRGVGSMAGNVNPNFIAAQNKEGEMQRHMMASGALEGNVNAALDRNPVEMGDLSRSAAQRNQFSAGLSEGRYNDEQNRYLGYKTHRENKPNFFKDLASKWLSPGGLISGAGMG